MNGSPVFTIMGGGSYGTTALRTRRLRGLLMPDFHELRAGVPRRTLDAIISHGLGRDTL